MRVFFCLQLIISLVYILFALLGKDINCEISSSKKKKKKKKKEGKKSKKESNGKKD